MTAFYPVFLQEDKINESCTSRQRCMSLHYTLSLDCVHDDPSMFSRSRNTCSCDIWVLVLENLLDSLFSCFLHPKFRQLADTFSHLHPFATFQWLTSICMIDSLRPHQGPGHSVPGTSCKSNHPRLWPGYPHCHGSPHRQDDGLLCRVFLHPGRSGRLKLPQPSS